LFRGSGTRGGTWAGGSDAGQESREPLIATFLPTSLCFLQPTSRRWATAQRGCRRNRTGKEAFRVDYERPQAKRKSVEQSKKQRESQMPTFLLFLVYFPGLVPLKNGECAGAHVVNAPSPCPTETKSEKQGNKPTRGRISHSRMRPHPRRVYVYSRTLLHPERGLQQKEARNPAAKEHAHPSLPHRKQEGNGTAHKHDKQALRCGPMGPRGAHITTRAPEAMPLSGPAPAGIAGGRSPRSCSDGRRTSLGSAPARPRTPSPHA